MNKARLNRVNEIVDKLNLLPHPEGGFYKEIYRSKGVISGKELGKEFNGERNFCTSIYFLLTSGNFSAFHRIKQDEIWNFHEGDTMIIHVIDEEGNYYNQKLGSDIINDEVYQFVVPAGAWFASEVVEGDSYALVGCTVAPGFDFNDFELAERDYLLGKFPKFKKLILKLTRN